MNDRDFLIDISNEISDAEGSLDRAHTVCRDLYNNYFGELNPESWRLISEYEYADARTSIVDDYVYQARETLKKIQGMIDTYSRK